MSGVYLGPDAPSLTRSCRPGTCRCSYLWTRIYNFRGARRKNEQGELSGLLSKLKRIYIGICMYTLYVRSVDKLGLKRKWSLFDEIFSFNAPLLENW